jgi:hypothetical protein
MILKSITALYIKIVIYQQQQQESYGVRSNSGKRFKLNPKLNSTSFQLQFSTKIKN